ncbi:MAG: hypothetical protein HN703_01465 [Planctomycetaceae bacterium]|nr:hypothetical protein [Planctomycetaceae bacterium]
MHALSKLFEALHLTRRVKHAGGHYRRRRQTSRRSSFLSCETLESKQLLAADLAQAFATIELDTTDPVTVAIEGKFQEDTVSGTVVKFETNAPVSDSDIYIELDANTPLTNANFLSYVNNGAYDNTIFHRSVNDFVLQGGGFTAPTADANQPSSDPIAIPTTGTVQNEPGNQNTRGTIAMAKLGGQPDSATSQFFFNVSDNSFLDSDNGGYTQFGQVLGSGMTTVDLLNDTVTYNAVDYYANTALAELPLYNVSADNIVKAQDFETITNADVVTESDLMTYVVSSSDSAKLTASFDGNGDLVLTPNASASGSVTVTVTATSKLDNLTASDTFSVQLNGGGPVAPVLTAIESNGVVLNQDQNGLLYAGDIALTSNGNILRFGQLSGWTPIGAETVDGTNYLAWQRSGSGSISQWQMDANWAYESYTAFSSGSPQFAQFETSFNIDADSDGSVGSFRQQVSTDAGLIILDVDTGTRQLYVGDVALTSGGNPIRDNQLGGWTPIGAETVDGVNYLAWKNNSNGSISRWQMDANWAYQDFSSFADGTTTFTEFEWDFRIDADGDSRRSIRGDTSGVLLQSNFTTRILYVGDVALTSGDNPIRDNQLGGWTPIGAETVVGVNYLAWKNNSNGSISRWQMDANWAYQDFSSFSAGTGAFAQFESDFGVDADNDGFVGPSRQAITTDTGVVALEVDTATRILYVGETALTSGSPLRDNQLGGWTPIAAETVDGVNYLAWRNNATKSISRWQMDANWAYESYFAFSVGSSAYAEFEIAFDVDADGNGVTG